MVNWPIVIQNLWLDAGFWNHNGCSFCSGFFCMAAKPRWVTTAAILLILVGLTFGCAWWWQKRQSELTPIAPQAQPKTAPHLFLGNPSGAKADPRNPLNFLIDRPQYSLSYNNDRRIPNWVSWELNQSWIGTTPRQDDFRPDPTLPANWYRVLSSDYSRSGFDRGHMIPSADRDNNPENQAATFFMTNIVPQSPDNNRGPWVRLEEYCRKLAGQGKQLYIIAGPYGQKATIGSVGKTITVPESVWKIVVILDRPVRSVNAIKSAQIIAVDIPNIQGIKEEGWGKYRVSIDQLEQKTGYDFLNQLPTPLQAELESKIP
jgi:endonuclease G